MLIRSLLATIVAAAFLVAACGTNTEAEPTMAPVATSPAATNDTTHTGVPTQLQFTAKTIDGQDFAAEGVIGKPAVFWFWAPWCPTCQREAPMVGQIADAHPEVMFVGVAALDQLPAMREFVDRFPVKGFTHLADTDGAVWANFGITQQPAYAFVGADGDIDVVRGSIPEAELTERVTSLANQ